LAEQISDHQLQTTPLQVAFPIIIDLLVSPPAPVAQWHPRTICISSPVTNIVSSLATTLPPLNPFMLSPRLFINTGRHLFRQASPRNQQFIQTFATASRIMAQEYKLKGLSSLDLKPGEKREVEVDGIEEGKVLLCNVGGNVTALGSKCTHYGAPLVKGILTGK
jgi:hypothetical protein